MLCWGWGAGISLVLNGTPLGVTRTGSAFRGLGFRVFTILALTTMQTVIVYAFVCEIFSLTEYAYGEIAIF